MGDFIDIEFDYNIANFILMHAIPGSIELQDSSYILKSLTINQLDNGEISIIGKITKECKSCSQWVMTYDLLGHCTEPRFNLHLNVPTWCAFKKYDIVTYDDLITTALITGDYQLNDLKDVCLKTYCIAYSVNNKDFCNVIHNATVLAPNARYANAEEIKRFVEAVNTYGNRKDKELISERNTYIANLNNIAASNTIRRILSVNDLKVAQQFVIADDANVEQYYFACLYPLQPTKYIIALDAVKNAKVLSIVSLLQYGYINCSQRDVIKFRIDRLTKTLSRYQQTYESYNTTNEVDNVTHEDAKC